MALAGVVVGDRVRILEAPREESTPERRVGDERDAEIAQRLQRFFRFGSVEQRIFVLHGGDRMNRVGTADRLRVRLGETQRAHLALLDRARHGADGVLDRHGRIDAMQIPEVDDVDLQALQTGVERLRHVLGAAVGDAATLAAEIAELRREHDVVAATRDRLAEQLLVVAEAIHVGAVEHGNAAIERLVDELERLGIVALAIDTRQRHEAEPHGGTRDPAASDLALRQFDLARHAFLPIFRSES